MIEARKPEKAKRVRHVIVGSIVQSPTRIGDSPIRASIVSTSETDRLYSKACRVLPSVYVNEFVSIDLSGTVCGKMIAPITQAK